MGKGIAYQNKDIMSKQFAEGMAGKSLEVYGLQVPRIKQSLNVEFPVVMANELFADNLYLMEDYSICIIDYESRYKWGNKIKYARYITQILTRYEKIKLDRESLSEDALKELEDLHRAWGGKIPKHIRVIVIYTGDVKESRNRSVLDVGAMRISVQEAYLSNLDTSGILTKLREKIVCGEKLTEQELMEFIILPLSVKGIEEKQKLAEEMVDLTDKVDDTHRRFLLCGMAIAGDKFLPDETSEKIRRRLTMTRIGMMFEKEKEEAVNAMKKQMNKEIRKRDRQIEKKDQQIVKKNQQIEKKDHQIKVMLAEIERLGGNTAAFGQ